MKCKICNGGLFIPLDDHTETFCKTASFLACKQYMLHAEKQLCLMEKVRKSEENRRRYLRIEISKKINLIKLFKSGKFISHVSSKTKTVDVSKGGMRVTIDNPLGYASMVQFSFDDSFPQALHKVTGHVEWCNKQIDKPGYQAGVSFHGDRIVEAMCLYLKKNCKCRG
ncbi:MAG: PilZ domain-containing protein [Desulforhopalus sp.]